MRRAANGILKSLKDQVRSVRYSIRAEAEAPGSMLPKLLHDLKPVLAIGNPALRLADGFFTEVETFATELWVHPEPAQGFPVPLRHLLDRSVSLSEHFYAPYKAVLTASNVRAMLISERALDQAGEQFRNRQGDLIPRARPITFTELVQASATLIRVLAEARPVRKVTFGAAGAARPNLMLSPNLFCAIVTGIATALVTLKPELAADQRAVLDSAESVADVRFKRFNRALTSRSPDEEIAKELAVLLPFLP